MIGKWLISIDPPVRITPFRSMIKRDVPDYQTCVFYLSGPNAMVNAFDETLTKMGVHLSRFKL